MLSSAFNSSGAGSGWAEARQWTHERSQAVVAPPAADVSTVYIPASQGRDNTVTAGGASASLSAASTVGLDAIAIEQRAHAQAIRAQGAEQQAQAQELRRLRSAIGR